MGSPRQWVGGKRKEVIWFKQIILRKPSGNAGFSIWETYFLIVGDLNDSSIVAKSAQPPTTQQVKKSLPYWPILESRWFSPFPPPQMRPILTRKLQGQQIECAVCGVAQARYVPVVSSWLQD